MSAVRHLDGSPTWMQLRPTCDGRSVGRSTAATTSRRLIWPGRSAGTGGDQEATRRQFTGTNRSPSTLRRSAFVRGAGAPFARQGTWEGNTVYSVTRPKGKRWRRRAFAWHARPATPY